MDEDDVESDGDDADEDDEADHGDEAEPESDVSVDRDDVRLPDELPELPVEDDEVKEPDERRSRPLRAPDIRGRAETRPTSACRGRAEAPGCTGTGPAGFTTARVAGIHDPPFPL